MKCVTILYLQVTLSLALAFSEMTSDDRDLYDGMADRGMFPREGLRADMRRDDPDEMDRFWNDEDAEDIDTSIDSNGYSSSTSITNNNNGVVSSYSYSSSSSNGQTIINGIDTSKLPANYHNVTTVKKIVNGKPVTVNVTIDKKTDPVTGQVSVSVSELSGNNKAATKFCRSSKQCKTGYFCKTSWVNTCQKCSNITQKCTQNAECCGAGTKGALCVYGKCQVGKRQGTAGTLCKTSRDCHSSMCCARKFMQRLGFCKPLAKKGEKCATSVSSMNEMLKPGICPCVKGLVCSSGSWTERFFGGSMNTFFGGNTCRIPRRRKARGSRRGWNGGYRYDDFYDDFYDRFAR